MKSPTFQTPLSREKLVRETTRRINVVRSLKPLKVIALLALASACVVSLCSSTARAQQYSIDWFSVDGGGGTSTGSVYSVSGTIGQADAGGPLTGGNYSLTGGFWSLIGVVQAPGAPRLSIYLTTTNTVVISWPSPSTGFSLIAKGDLSTTNWVQVAQIPSDDGVTKRVILPSRSGNLFLRLMK